MGYYEDRREQGEGRGKRHEYAEVLGQWKFQLRHPTVLGNGGLNCVARRENNLQYGWTLSKKQMVLASIQLRGKWLTPIKGEKGRGEGKKWMFAFCGIRGVRGADSFERFSTLAR